MIEPLAPRLAAAVVGLLLLVAGRRVFWLGVGGLGFLLGFELATRWISVVSPTAQLVWGLVGGGLGAALALLLPRLAVRIGGFFLGLVLGAEALSLFGYEAGPWQPLLILGLGILAALAAGAMLDVAVVGITSLTGGLLLARASELPPPFPFVVLVVAFVVGLLIQGRRRPRSRKTG